MLYYSCFLDMHSVQHIWNIEVLGEFAAHGLILFMADSQLWEL